MNTKRLTKLMSLVLVLVMCLAVLCACPTFEPDESLKGQYTYQDYTTLSPSNWNELTYQDNNDTQIMGYIGSSFFSFDYKFDDNGDIVPGDFTVNYNAATSLVDVTAKYADAWDLDPKGKGYAYAITLRNDLKWENGDSITAADFVYTMKEQLDPNYLHYRADSFYNSAQSLVGAKSYAKQGQKGWFDAYTVYGYGYDESLDNDLIFKLAVATPNGEGMDAVTGYTRKDWGFPDNYDTKAMGDYFAANYAAYFPLTTGDKWAAMEGKTLAEIKADPELAPLIDEIENALGITTCCVVNYTFPKVDWVDENGNPNVGIFVGENELELVIVLEKALDLLDEDGNLTYKAAYNMSSLPLVHKATYEACKQAPVEGSELWTTNYCSSVETTMSWGPYKLTEFQAGKYYVVERNTNWYGYNMEENEGLYQTDRIYCETIGEWNTAWLKFQAGEIEGIGIDVSIADEYKGSERAYFTPDDYVGSLQLQSNKEALAKRESDGVNKTILTYVDFRKALSLSIDRAEYAQKCTTASKEGFGLFNTMHYNDVANGGVFRDTDDAKKVLCEIYNVDWTQYPSLDDAVDAVTGYNVAAAQELVNSAYAAAIAAGDIKETDKVVLTFGTGAINEAVQRHFDYLTNAWTTMFAGTDLAGKVEFELKDFSTAWANDFKAGAYDICMGGWSGAAWDPGYFLLAYLDKGYMYSKAWDTSAAMMTFTMKGVKGEDGEDITDTMSLYDWYLCLNGDTDAQYDFSSNALPESLRAQLIAALEKEILAVYYTVPTYNSFGASLLSYKIDYITYEYNTFMGYGGMKYMRYNYDDYDWSILVHENNGQLNYK